MEKKKIVPTWLSILLVVLCAFSIGANAWRIVCDIINKNFDVLNSLNIIIFTVSSILALIYCFKGYKKDANKIFKLCSVVFTIALLLQVAYKALPNSTPGQKLDVPAEVEMPAPVEAEMPAPVEEGNFPRTSEYDSSMIIVTSTIAFGCMMVLSIAENLGKKKSLILVAVVLVSTLIAAIATVDMQNISTIVLNVNFGAFINAVIYGIMIYAKYQDKEARGTK